MVSYLRELSPHAFVQLLGVLRFCGAVLHIIDWTSDNIVIPSIRFQPVWISLTMKVEAIIGRVDRLGELLVCDRLRARGIIERLAIWIDRRWQRLGVLVAF